MRSGNRALGLLRAATHTLEDWLRLLVRRTPRRNRAVENKGDALKPETSAGLSVAADLAEAGSGAAYDEPLTPHRGPPADWLERVGSPGPPEDWLERVENAKSPAADADAQDFSGQAAPEDKERQRSKPIPSAQLEKEDGIPPPAATPARQTRSLPGVPQMNTPSRAPDSGRRQSSIRSRREPPPEAQVRPTSPRIEPQTQDQSPTADKAERGGSREREAEISGEPPAEIYQPRPARQQKTGSPKSEARSDSSPAVVIRAGRVSGRAPEDREHSAQPQVDLGKARSSPSARTQARHSGQDEPSHSRGGAAGSTEGESGIRGELSGWRAEPTVSMLQQQEKPSRDEAKDDDRSPEGWTWQERPAPARPPGPPRTKSDTTRLSRVPQETLTRGPAGDQEKDRLEVLPPSDVSLSNPELSTFEPGESSSRVLDSVWPELPAEESADAADDVTGAMRVWTHLERLNAEQRGVEWSG